MSRPEIDRYNGNTILVVDDDRLVLETVSSLFTMWGYAVTACGDARGALEEFRKGGIDLVLTDIRMPEITGTELLGKIRDLDAEVPVILMTAFAEIDMAIDALRNGAFDFIIKPFKPDYLQCTVEKAIKFRKLMESERKYEAVLEEKVRESESNLAAAAKIQEILLPVSVPEGVPFDFAWRFHPCGKVGGDLCNFFMLDEGHLGAFIMDVSGHGVYAAMINTMVAQSLNPFSSQILKRVTYAPPYYELASPGEVLASLNREFTIERLGAYVTICYLLLDMRSGKVRYSNAGHPLPLLIRADGLIETLTEGGTIIGIGECAVYEEGEVSMERGDRLFLYTDGIVEQSDTAGVLYGKGRLIPELSAAHGDTLQNACDRVMQSLLSFSGGKQPEDDITLLGIQFRPDA